MAASSGATARARVNPSALDVFTVDAGRGGPTLASLRELWSFREVLSAFIVRRVKVRYQQALFGVAWVVIQPVAIALVFALFLGRLARFPSGGVPYFLFVLSGLTIWWYFSQTMAVASDSLVSEASLLRKVFFPRVIPPLAIVVAGLLDLLLVFAVLLPLAITSGKGPSLTWLFVPIAVLIVVLTATGIGILFAGINVYYRDVSNGMPFLLQLGLFVSPVIYPVTLVPSGFRDLYQILNPVAASIQVLRSSVLGGQPPDFFVTGLALAWSIGILAIGYTVFTMIERRFADHV